MTACVCGMVQTLPKKLRKDDLNDLVAQTKLTAEEVMALYARFRRLAPTGYLLPEQFKQTMGVVGVSGDHFLSDRMFKVLDGDQDGKLSFSEFAISLAIMIRGTEDEKLKLSFDMAAGRRGAPGISLDDFRRLICACNTTMSCLVVAPSKGPTSEEDIQNLFEALSVCSEDTEQEAMITLEAYKAAAQNNEDFLTCLGLEPNTRKAVTHVVAGDKNKCNVNVPKDHVLVSNAQLDDLRDRVTQVNMLIQNRLQSTTPTETAVAVNEPNEHFSFSRRPGTGSQQKCGGALDDVISELSWCCAQLAREVCGGGGINAGGVGKQTARPTSRSSSPNQIGEESGTRPIASSEHIFFPSPSGQTMHKSNIHAPAGNSVTGVLPNSHTKTPNKISTNTVSQRTSRRRQRRHRLLGPKKGLAVHFGHENWNMVLSMMIGIRMSVGRSKHEISRELQPVDFIMKEKFSIIPRLANIFDSAVSKRVHMTRFIDYAPMVFQRIRQNFGIQEDDYVRSVGPEQLLGNMVLGNLSSLSEQSSEGKSGAYFYYTADGKYMMKTVVPKEYHLFRKMLKQYYDHFMENPGTMVVRFLGLHCLRVQKHRKGRKRFFRSTRKLYFVVMANIFSTPFVIHRRYDLKGSWVGRVTATGKCDPAVALKDVDFQQANEKIRVGEECRAMLLKQLERDSAFLCSNNIIDYSLLLGIHETGGKIRHGMHINPSIIGAAEDTEDSDRDVFMSVALPRQNNTQQQASIATDTPGNTRRFLGTQQQQPPASEGTIETPLHRRDAGGLLSSDTQSLYFFGVLDIFTAYDSIKKLEHNWKALWHDRGGVSCCPPGLYAERFNHFMRDAFV